ncbi:SdrD B-like domain-containing protein [Leifsonia shinshuensis]|uniref:SD-repeat containing protein B domain-containing protein n=1 Tax=Leifsonia shinshuensis TaxID=150026 RepID=A0A853CZA5_9MICO|nr:hypothetical protein [Leifsonia shinshuensis]
MAVLLSLTGLAALAAPADAAEIPGAITSVKTDKSSYGYSERLRLDFTWAVPDGSAPGDTFSLQLPAALSAASLARFTLAAADGSPVATAAWNGKTVVFTLTDYVATHRSVGGSGFLTAQWDHSVVTETGGPVVLTFGTSVTTVEIAPKPTPQPTDPGTSQPSPPPTQRGLWKGAGWADGSYEGTRDPSDNINWLVELPGNPTGFTGPIDIVDHTGQGSAIDCASIRITARAGLAAGTPTTTLDPSRSTVTCADGTLHIVLDRIKPDEFIDVRYKGTITDQGLGSYSNAVTVTAPAQTWTKTQTIKRTAAGGVGSGTQSVSVGDYVWLDTDANGRQDAGEHGIPGVTMVLTGPTGGPVTDIDGHVVQPTVTDAGGKYLFSRLPVLPAGQHYTVTIDKDASAKALNGLTPTLEHIGDSAGDSSTWTATSTDLTTDGAADLTLDFGFTAKATPSGPLTTPSAPATPASPAAPAAAPPAPPVDPAAGGAGDTVVLAHTGSDVALPIVATVVLLTLGLGGVLLGRRRRPSHRGRVHS